MLGRARDSRAGASHWCLELGSRVSGCRALGLVPAQWCVGPDSGPFGGQGVSSGGCVRRKP